jgi:hypothetical protein
MAKDSFNINSVEDEDGYLNDIEDLVSQVKDLGEIKVTFYRKAHISPPFNVKEESKAVIRTQKLARHQRKCAMRTRNKLQIENRLSRLDDLQSIPEKALKGRSIDLRAA